MKKILMILSILLAFAVSASAQVPSPFTFYAGGLVSQPISPDGFKDNFNTGWHGSLGVGYSVAPKIKVVGKLEYHTFSFNFDDAAYAGFSGGTNNIWMFGADGRYDLDMPASPISPYFFGGLGLANMKQTEFSGPTSLVTAINQVIAEDQTNVYYNIGAGIGLGGGPAMNFFVQVRYVSIQTEGDAATFVPITLGLQFF